MKRTSIVASLAALTALTASQAQAACSDPGKPPDIPDGTKATAADILKTQDGVVAFNNATNTYLACLKKEHDDALAAAGPSISSSQADKIDRTESTAHNAAVDQLNDVVHRFNQSVQSFQAKQKADAEAAAAAAAAKKGKSGGKSSGS
jgi:hypothetical protein